MLCETFKHNSVVKMRALIIVVSMIVVSFVSAQRNIIPSPGNLALKVMQRCQMKNSLSTFLDVKTPANSMDEHRIVQIIIISLMAAVTVKKDLLD